MAHKPASAQLGRNGERLAQTFLESLGYRFVARNWHCASGELDLIMLDGNELVFVEVKTRRGERSGRAGEAVSPSKATKLLRAAEWFIAQHAEHHDRVWRCDLVAITMSVSAPTPRILHYVNAIVMG
ncbi:MAG: YraN family protein [Chloroflexota bacterium]|nr:YraN family protein [Chloroflexota bacterium]